MLPTLRPSQYIVYAFAAFVSLAALPLGGNIPFAWAINGMVAGGLLFWYACTLVVFSRAPAVNIKHIRLLLIGYSIVCIWVLLQGSWLSQFAAHPLWKEAARVLNMGTVNAVSINPADTVMGAIRLLTYGVVFWLALQIGREVRHAEFLLRCIVCAILLNAIYALLLWGAGSQTLLWFDKWVGHEEVTGTFVNRNHFAAYIGMGCVLSSLFLFRAFKRFSQGFSNVKRNALPQLIVTELLWKNAFVIISCFTLFTVLLLTRSRAGFACTIIALISLVLMRFVFAKGQTSEYPGIGMGYLRSFALRAALFFVCISAGLAVVQNGEGGRLVERLMTEQAIDFERLGVFYKTLDAIQDSPFVGSGYGTFPDAFPAYRDVSLSAYGRWNQAHNSYLENMMELGIPVAVLFFSLIGWCVYRNFSGGLKRQKDSSYSQVAFAVSVLLLLHSLIDFPLQLSGIVITYAALLGVGVAQSWSSRELRSS